MSGRDIGLATLVAAVWGITFVFIRMGVEVSPPLGFSGLRFLFAAVPAVFFLRPPAAPPFMVALYGLLIGVGQFGLLFIAIRQGMPIGLASLVIQLQAFVTVALAFFLLGERASAAALIGAGIALAGMALIGYARFQNAALAPFLLTIAAASCWGAGNVVGKLAARKAGKIDMLAFTVWSSLAAPLPLFALSYGFEGDKLMVAAAHPTMKLAVAVLGVAYLGTIFGYGVWSRLLAKYQTAEVAPFSLLVPVVGMVAAWTIYGERFGAIEAVGGLLVMAGLVVNVFGGRLGGPTPSSFETAPAGPPQDEGVIV